MLNETFEHCHMLISHGSWFSHSALNGRYVQSIDTSCEPYSMRSIASDLHCERKWAFLVTLSAQLQFTHSLYIQ